MSQENSVRPSVENKDFDEFIQKAKKRDSAVFFIGTLIFVLTAVVGYTHLYQSFKAMNEELANYRLAVANSQKEVQTLRETIKTQEGDLQSLRSFVNVVKDSEIRSLIGYAANHRKEIDILKKDVQCLKRNPAKPCS